MPKQIDSPNKRWPGHVVLHAPLNWRQYAAFQDALTEANALYESNAPNQSRIDAALIPGLCACVAEWHLSDLPAVVTLDTFPFTPRRNSSALVSWLLKEVTALVTEADADIPNG